MINYDDVRSLGDIIQAGERIRTICGGSFTNVPADDDGGPGTELREAIKYNLIVIGEAAGRVTEDTRAQAPEVPWKRVVGLRNILTHRYHNVDEAVVAETVSRHLLPLLGACERLRDEQSGQ